MLATAMNDTFDSDSLARLVRDAIQHAVILGRIAAKHDDHVEAMMTYLKVPTPQCCVSMTGLEEIMDRLWGLLVESTKGV